MLTAAQSLRSTTRTGGRATCGHRPVYAATCPAASSVSRRRSATTCGGLLVGHRGAGFCQRARGGGGQIPVNELRHAPTVPAPDTTGAESASRNSRDQQPQAARVAAIWSRAAWAWSAVAGRRRP